VQRDEDSGLVALSTPTTPVGQVQVASDLLLGLGPTGHLVEIESLGPRLRWVVVPTERELIEGRVASLRVADTADYLVAPVDFVTNQDRSLLLILLCLGSEPLEVLELGPNLLASVDSDDVLVSLTVSWDHAIDAIGARLARDFGTLPTYANEVRRRLDAVIRDLAGMAPPDPRDLALQDATHLVNIVESGLSGNRPTEIRIDARVDIAMPDRPDAFDGPRRRRVHALAIGASILFDRPITWQG
jgi:hypothetical protein